MIALEQKDKVRIIMDLSSPKGESFNDCVDELHLEKVNMSTARQFGYSVVDCGIGAAYTNGIWWTPIKIFRYLSIR